MVPNLRKRHRLIWSAFAVILPVLFVAAVLVIPRPVYQEELYKADEKQQQGAPVPADQQNEQDQ